jgi:CHAT domain-containing protein/predicted negative regulator of RcsB-dependent stress response
MKHFFKIAFLGLILTGSLGIPSVNARVSLEKEAQNLYENGQYQEALSYLATLVIDYEKGGKVLDQAQALSNMALVYQEIGELKRSEIALETSLNLLENQPQTTINQRLLASTLEVKGKLLLSVNNSADALTTWQEVEAIYTDLKDLEGISRSKVNQALAMRRLGFHNQALKTLEASQKILAQQPDQRIKAISLQQLGDSLRALGHLEKSVETLNQALEIAESLSDDRLINSIFLSLGNTRRFEENHDLALDFYKKVSQSDFLGLSTKAKSNQLSLLIDNNINQNEAKFLVDEIEFNLTKLPVNRDAINIRINLAESLRKIGNMRSSGEHLAIAIQEAEKLGDRRSFAYALGELGHLYEQQKQWPQAAEITEKALQITQSFQGADLAYRLQWQLGRILIAQGEREQAIAYYEQAVSNLQSLRSDLVSINTEVQFSFRESVEPVYREYVSLLLTPNQQVDQGRLRQARSVIESLQLAELDDFFRDACLDTKPVDIDQADQKATIIYPIILSDRLEVIASLPNQPLQRHTTFLSEAEIEATLDKLRTRITRQYRIPPLFKTHLEPAQEIYDWLIRPIVPLLKQNGVETLVFVLDGALRNLPMGVLHDGEKYLIENYNLAVTPGLQLIDLSPLERQNLGVIAAGISKSRQNFAPLPNVERELAQIEKTTQSAILLNEAFTKANFQATLDRLPFPVLHLATHGQFSSNAENTFILTWDDRITANDLDNLLRSDLTQKNPIELLILSACQTATGDRRAALGLAGIATRAGARSTVASLWSVSDEATSLLMSQFYQELVNSNIPKSEALRRSQTAVLQTEQFAHPYYWSAFVMVGNWQ